MPESRKPRTRPVHTASAGDRRVPLPVGTRVLRIPVDNANRRPALFGTVMCHAEAVGSRGSFSVRWDTGIWEAHLDVSYVTAVAQDATVTALRSTRRRAAS